MQMAMQRHEHVLTHLSIHHFRIFKATMLLTAIGRVLPKSPPHPSSASSLDQTIKNDMPLIFDGGRQSSDYGHLLL